MENYLNVANSGLLFLIAAVIFVLIVCQSIIFFVTAWKEGQRRGIEKARMLKAVKSSAVLSIVPSIPIVISLIAMAPVLGIPFPWIRLSVLGSASYELMAAGMGAEIMGISGLGGDGYTAEVFSSSTWIMTLGTISAPIILVFFLKRISSGFKKVQAKDSTWMHALIMAAYMGLISVFIGPPITRGGIELITLLSGAVIMLISTFIERKFKVAWLKEFALSFSMIGAMAAAILFSNIFKGVL
ncbi:MAG: DUF5058 family protein [Spirochaetales bacterium]|uniref:DUF5058 family protein n=1 Tax=Candidatus Thalassospirochaeta sargassi TaxID=3119039 RepID=A0AAJ1IFE2_9SPIO|nr:DUF5058 family protein [Spirochaetales bacterium]